MTMEFTTSEFTGVICPDCRDSPTCFASHRLDGYLSLSCDACTGGYLQRVEFSDDTWAVFITQEVLDD